MAAGRSDEASGELQFQHNEAQRLKARVKARLLGRPELAPHIGHFKLVRRLGQGASGVVYEAQDTRSGAMLALKLLRHPHAKNITRFKQEFRGLSHLSHENLVQLHELYADGDEWFFTMELVRGVPFTEYVRSSARRSEGCELPSLRAALIALCQAVQAVHDAGRLHCDLKPSNVLVTEAGRVIVLDFGLVTEPDEGFEVGGAVFGTPTYMAPELSSGAAPTSATDAYAIGVMLSQALSQPTALSDESVQASSERSETQALLQEVCNGLLRHEPATRLTIERVLHRLGGPVAVEHVRSVLPTPRSAFVGRDRELAVLEAAFARAQTGLPMAVFLHGPSGIGKTTLCDRFADELRGRALVLRGRCHERESLPYKAFDGVIDALACELAAWPSEKTHGLTASLEPSFVAALLRVFPSLRGNGLWPDAQIPLASANPSELRQQAFSGLKMLLRGIALMTPLVLIVDDLQWADLDSARLLFELLGPPAAPSLLYAGSYRSEETQRSEFLLELVGPSAAARWQSPYELLALDALSEDHALVLAARLLEGSSADPLRAASRIARDSAGVPFLVTELARHFANDPRDSGAPPSLSALLSERIDALTPNARRMLGLIALAGRPVGYQFLGRALAGDPNWERTLRMLSIAGLVRGGTDGDLVVYHDRLREQVVRLLRHEDATALHRVLATTYEGARDSEPEWLIEHFRGAGDVTRAFDYAIQAATLAVHKLAFNRAAALYRTALELSDANDPRRGELHARLGDALVNAGRSAEAAAALLDAVPYADQESSIQLRCRVVQQYLRCGRTAQGHALLRRLLRDVGVSYPDNERALYVHIALSRVRLALLESRWGRRGHSGSASTRRRLLVLESVFRECAVSEPVLGALFQSLFHEEALRAGNSEAQYMALAWNAYNQSFLGGFGARRASARRIRKLEALSTGVKSPYARGTLAMIRCGAALFEGRYSEVDRLGRQAQDLFRQQCLGTYWEESVSATLRYTALEMTGPLTLFRDDAPQLLRRANESEDHFAEALLSRTMLLALLAQDEPGRALEFLTDRLPDLDDRVDLRAAIVTMSVADCHSYAGSPGEAWRSFERHWEQFRRSLLARSRYLVVMNQYRRGRLALSLAAVTRSRAQVRIAMQHTHFLEKMRWPIADVFAGALRAALAWHRGDVAETHNRLRIAELGAHRLDDRMSALCLRRQRGVVTGSHEGSSLIAQADEALRDQGVVNPERWVDLVLPSGVGCTPRDSG